MLTPKPFYIIRHGETEANAARTASGHVDTPLTALGRAQAHEAKDMIADISPRPSFIVHSHLSRARDTANIINEPLGLPTFELSDVAEQHFGDWQGKPWDLIRDARLKGEDPPNGETAKIFQQRVMRGINAAMTYGDGIPLIVCHGGVVNAIWVAHGAPFQSVGNCALFYFEPDAKAAGPLPFSITSYCA
jgi:uncharacterized phosphatase